jgi:hypothetical protein
MTSLDKNELRLCRASQYRDQVQIVATIAKYTSSFGLFIRILHLEVRKCLDQPNAR